ncbi:MAG: hypothetical protein AB1898_22220 [Acidobacteriota bacterium]
MNHKQKTPAWIAQRLVLVGSLFGLTAVVPFPPSSAAKENQPRPKGRIANVNEEGTFKILFAGEEVGEERFRIQSEGQRLKADAEISLTMERENGRVTFRLLPVLEFTPVFEPLNYEITQEAGDNRSRARVQFGVEGHSSVTYEIGKERDQREIELKNDVAVLDDNVFHHYILLTRRFDFVKGGAQEFSAFVPQQFLSGAVKVVDQGFEEVKVGESSLSLQHLSVDTGELQIDLWLTDQGKLERIAVPKSNVEVIRRD